MITDRMVDLEFWFGWNYEPDGYPPVHRTEMSGQTFRLLHELAVGR